jgi:ribokinase
MKILNVGSINVDHVYTVPHFVRPGETIGATGYRVFSGGKGFNQSIALARAGAEVLHAGQVGKDGEWLVEELRRNGVDTTHVALSGEATGHALIQVAPSGENAIVVHGGANQTLAPPATASSSRTKRTAWPGRSLPRRRAECASSSIPLP